MPPLNSKDVAPRVAISIAGLDTATSTLPEFSFEGLPTGGEVVVCKSWTLDFDLQQLGDPFSVEIDNADGRHTGKVRPFDSCKVYLQDRTVGGYWVPLYDGIVTNVQNNSTRDGDTITISGADRGWFLVNCHVTPWISLEVSTWDLMVSKLVDPTWGFGPANIGNDVKHHVSQGRAGAVRYLTQKAVPKLQPFQTDVGQSPADVLLHYGKIAKCLINVYGSTIQIFKPAYSRTVDYKIEAHKSTETNRNDGNVEQCSLVNSGDGLYTEVRCYSSVVAPPPTNQSDRVHAGEYRGTVFNTGNIPQGYHRLFAFSDGEQMSRDNCIARATWKLQRGIFDSWTYSATVYGVSQGGLLYAPDSMIEIDDTINGVTGNYYLTAVRMHCDKMSGTTSQLTIKKAGLLGG